MRLTKLLTLVLFCLFLGCKKYKHNYIQGKVLEYDSWIGIGGATVILQYWDASSKNGFYAYDSINSDGDGHFSFYRNEKRGWEYKLTVRDNNHFGSGMDIDKAYPPFLIYLNAFSYLKIRVKKITSNPTAVNIALANNSFYFNSQNPFDTIINKVITVAAKNPFQINWNITDSSLPTGPQNPNPLSTTVNLNKGDTLTYLIQYN